MKLKIVKSTLSRNLINLVGWRSSRRIVVIESDDWGSIRMPSRKVYDELVARGYPLESRPFERYDSLTTAEDLSRLFDTLRQFRDANGRHPVFTANTVMTNPDFDRIRADAFQKYHYELFTRTLERYGYSEAFHFWKAGIREGIFKPQLHGREHVNVDRWMKSLQESDPDAILSFDFEMAGNPSISNPELGNRLMVAYAFDDAESLGRHLDRLREACELFNLVFGYQSASFIAPTYVWNRDMEEALGSSGVQFLQGGAIQKNAFVKSYRPEPHYLGQTNVFGQRYLIRNVYFEPSSNPNRDWVSESLRYIATAFRWSKPAIISTHRLNYVGGIDPKNRDRGNLLLRNLLTEILKQWPQVEFMSSDELGRLIVDTEAA